MFIIADGTLTISTMMDNTKMVVEYLTQGSSLNAVMMLFGSKTNVEASCLSKVIVYELRQEKFFEIVEQYFDYNNALLLKLAKIQEGAEDLIALDYV